MYKTDPDSGFGAYVEAYRCHPLISNEEIIDWAIDYTDPVDVGYQLHYCNYVYIKLVIHLPQDNMYQGLSGIFTGKVGVIQWNDQCEDITPVTCIIQGYKFHDLNRNGFHDPGEPPMNNVLFELLQWVIPAPGESPILVPATDVTSTPVEVELTVNGEFSFINLMEGMYVVRERLDLTDTNGDGILDAGDFVGGIFIDQGLRPSKPAEYELTLTSGEHANPTSHPSLEFGNYYTGSIHGYKFLDLDGDGTDNGGTDPRIADITITLTGPVSGSPLTNITDSNGEYTFKQLPPGTYTVTETLPVGSTPTTPTSVIITIISGEEAVAEAGQAGDLPDFKFETINPSLAFGNQEQTPP
jgi:hypothetical protein